MVELVIVLIILGVLAATALPRFASVTDDAHETSVAAVGGSLGTAVSLVHAQWLANGATGAVDNLAGFGNSNVDINTTGWPTDTAGSNNVGNAASRCVNIWNGIMQNPPRVDVNTNSSPDWVATASGENCTFTYQAKAGMSVLYNASTGSVTVDDVPS